MKAENLKVLPAMAVILLSVVMTQCTIEEVSLPIFENQGSIGPEGGIIRTADGASVEIPAGALGSGQTIKIENTTSTDVVANNGCLIYEFTPDGLTFSDSVTISLPFDDEYIDSESEDINHGVFIMVYQDSVWKKLRTEVNLSESIATAKTVHFSKYGIVFPYLWTDYFKTNRNKSSRILSVPYYNQGGTGWCALYSLNMITRYAGYDFRAPGFAVMLDKDDQEELLTREEWILGPLFKMLGIDAEVSFPYWIDMEELCGYLIYNLNNGFPVMLGSANHNHAVVITGYNQTGFYINDPGGNMLEYVRPGIRDEELNMCHVTYDDFLDLMSFGDENTATTFVIKSSSSSQGNGMTLNFIPGRPQIVVRNAENSIVGGLDFGGKRYSPSGYSLINYQDSSNMIEATDVIEVLGVLSNSNTGQDVTVNYQIMIDDIIIKDGSQIVTVPGPGAFTLTEMKSCQLSELNEGSHILRAEILSSDPSGNVLDSWEFPFRTRKREVLDPSCLYFDSGINTTIWTATSGTWDIQSGELHGYWDWGAAHADQAIIMVSETLYNPDSYTATACVKVRTGSEICGERFALRSSAGNQILIGFNWELGIVAAEYKAENSMYTQLHTVNGYNGFKTEVGEINEYKVIKNGTLITVFVNSNEIFQFEDIYFNGNTKLGLGAYGNAYYERFCLR